MRRPRGRRRGEWWWWGGGGGGGGGPRGESRLTSRLPALRRARGVYIQCLSRRSMYGGVERGDFRLLRWAALVTCVSQSVYTTLLL